MSITNDERRRVASRLRDFYNIRPMFMESVICGFLDVLDIGYLNWEGICNRLADLIEPEPERTCQNLGREEGTIFELYDFGCSECGFGCDVCEPNYCPNCGAKVID